MDGSSNLLALVLADPSAARKVVDGVWSALPSGTPSQPYDGRARLYDRLIGSRLYNRVAWGTSPASYAAFAQAAARCGEGPLLDAGCGTLVSTAEVHARSGRPTVLVDLSVDMLRAARDRLLSLAGRVPEHLVLLQADLSALPFRDSAFGAVLCPGVLHLFEEVEAVTRELARVTVPGARLFMTSLVAERWLSARYLSALHRTGEVATPRTRADLVDRLHAAGSGLARPIEARMEGAMAFVTAEAVDSTTVDVRLASKAGICAQ